MREVWAPTCHRINDVITLHDEAGVVMLKPRRYVAEREYFIGQVEVTWDSRDEAPFVKLLTAKGRKYDGPVKLDGGYLFSDQLREVPTWLTDIIERSRPRLP